MRPRLDRALKALYKDADVNIRTPDLTLQVQAIDSAPFVKNAIYSSFNGFWLDDPVIVKALRRPRDRAAPSKVGAFFYFQLPLDYNTIQALGKDFEHYFNVRHPNIARVYGMYVNDTLGYCVVSIPFRK